MITREFSDLQDTTMRIHNRWVLIFKYPSHRGGGQRTNTHYILFRWSEAILESFHIFSRPQRSRDNISCWCKCHCETGDNTKEWLLGFHTKHNLLNVLLQSKPKEVSFLGSCVHLLKHFYVIKLAVNTLLCG